MFNLSYSEFLKVGT